MEHSSVKEHGEKDRQIEKPQRLRSSLHRNRRHNNPGHTLDPAEEADSRHIGHARFQLDTVPYLIRDHPVPKGKRLHRGGAAVQPECELVEKDNNIEAYQ